MPSDYGEGKFDHDSLGPALIEAGLVSPEQMQVAATEARQNDQSLGRVLVDKGIASETDVVVTTAHKLGHLYVELDEYPIDDACVALMTETMARRYQAIPIAWEDGELVVAMANPSDVFAVDDIRIITGAELRVMVTTPSALQRTIDRMYRLDQAGDVAHKAAVQAGFVEQVAPDLGADDAPVVRLVNMLVNQALVDRASDIHLEPTSHDIRVRYRIDGVLHEVQRLPRAILGPVTSRLKIMAELNIAERRIPQDGRVHINVGGTMADLRVAVLPTVNGEQITMRVLDKTKALLSMDDLGFLPEIRDRYDKVFRRPYGTILVTGPTGSGKSTTLYATLNALNDESRKIITVEDPVEYQLPGVAQIQVNPKAGLTFASALRSILRSDPDVVLVGEIRDGETAKTAVEAALTGHLVFSTLHTNDAASSPTRLVEMGVEPYLVATALDAVVAQRLARRLCLKCREPDVPTDAEVDVLGEVTHEPPVTVMRPVGCPVCGRTGYHGRLAIHELMFVTEELERHIALNAPSEDIHKVAVAQGMRTLRQAGLTHAIQGTTSVEEVLRVVV